MPGQLEFAFYVYIRRQKTYVHVNLFEFLGWVSVHCFNKDELWFPTFSCHRVLGLQVVSVSNLVVFSIPASGILLQPLHNHFRDCVKGLSNFQLAAQWAVRGSCLSHDLHQNIIQETQRKVKRCQAQCLPGNYKDGWEEHGRRGML